MNEAEIVKTFEAYEFKVPSLDDIRTLSIEFNNDRWGGDRATGDRNLYIGGVSVGSADLSLGQLQITQGAGDLVGAYAILWSNGSASIRKPSEGWLPVVSPAPAETVSCSGEFTIELRGYAENQTRPSDGDVSQLMKWIESIPALSSCKIDIAASTSPTGSALANARIAQARSVEIE